MAANDEKAREERLHRLLASSLRLGLGRGGTDCPDPEILAAYFDRSLSPSEASRWDSHFSACGRCQQVLAALATTEPEPMIVAEEHVAAVAAPPQAAKAARRAVPAQAKEAGRPLRRYLSWQWLVPVAAAAALAVWFVARPVPLSRSKTEMARESQPPPPGASVASQTPAPASKELAQNLPAQGPAFRAQTKGPPASQNASKEPNRELLARPGTAPQAEASKTLRTDAAGGREAKAAPARESRSLQITAAPPSAPSEEATSAAQKSGVEKKESTGVAPAPLSAGQTAESSASAKAGAKAAEGKRAEARPGAAGFGALGKLSAAKPGAVADRVRFRSAPVIVASPAHDVLWRLGAEGLIERSRDAGRTWQVQVSNADADLLAGSAPAETVCWVVGRAGTILRTLDGEHWVRISSPVVADWTAVKAQDALHVSISTASGETYVTQDGGRTWQGPAGP